MSLSMYGVNPYAGTGAITLGDCPFLSDSGNNSVNIFDASLNKPITLNPDVYKIMKKKQTPKQGIKQRKVGSNPFREEVNVAQAQKASKSQTAKSSKGVRKTKKAKVQQNTTNNPFVNTQQVNVAQNNASQSGGLWSSIKNWFGNLFSSDSKPAVNTPAPVVVTPAKGATEPIYVENGWRVVEDTPKKQEPKGLWATLGDWGMKAFNGVAKFISEPFTTVRKLVFGEPQSRAGRIVNTIGDITLGLPLYFCAPPAVGLGVGGFLMANGLTNYFLQD